MTTSVPNTPQELLNMNLNTNQEDPETTPVTPESLLEDYLELSYDDQDNFIFHLLQGQLKFHLFLLEKSKNGDPNLPNTESLEKDVRRLQICCDLYQLVQ